VNTSLSLAAVPVISGRTVTITLKHYRWSNGAPVTAQDGMFWINLDRAVPQDWFDYSPGTFPANVSNINMVGTNKLVMTINKAYSSTWFVYNELAQITPMPAAWDRTASGPSNWDTTVSDCAAVESYLLGQAKDLFMPSSGQRPKGPGPLELTASYTGQAHRVAMCAGGLGQLVPPDMVGR
jgi:peptide/nickel transport system substrate-binding protein